LILRQVVKDLSRNSRPRALKTKNQKSKKEANFEKAHEYFQCAFSFVPRAYISVSHLEVTENAGQLTASLGREYGKGNGSSCGTNISEYRAHAPDCRRGAVSLLPGRSESVQPVRKLSPNG
jgi:hypothetical protein